MSAAVHRQPNTKSFWSASREDCLAAVLRAYREEGMVAQTVRHYYYKLLSYGLLRALPQYPNSAHNAYKFVVDLCTDARRSRGGDLPYEAVVDPSRRSFTHWSQNSLAEMLRTKRSGSYWADLWRGQPRRLAVFVEKDGMADMANSVVGGWQIPVYVCKGHSSVSSLHRVAPTFGTGRGWTLLYAGDFDPTGLDIDRFLRDELRRHGCRPEIVRVALTKELALALPPEAAVPLKDSDVRTPKFKRLYPGMQGYEVEALPAGRLRGLLRNAVGEYMDPAAWNTAIAVKDATAEMVERELRHVFTGLERRTLADGIPGLRVPLDTQRLYLLPKGVAYEDYEPEDDDEDDDDGGEGGDDDGGFSGGPGPTSSPGARAAWQRYLAAPEGSEEEDEAWAEWELLRDETKGEDGDGDDDDDDDEDDGDDDGAGDSAPAARSELDAAWQRYHAAPTDSDEKRRAFADVQRLLQAANITFADDTLRRSLLVGAGVADPAAYVYVLRQEPEAFATWYRTVGYPADRVLSYQLRQAYANFLLLGRDWTQQHIADLFGVPTFMSLWVRHEPEA